MLLTLTTLVWYGPAAGACVEAGAASTVAQTFGYGQASAATSGDGAITLADATRLVNSPLAAAGLGVVTTAIPKARARPALHVKVGELSQDDVAGALQNLNIEDGLTLRDVLRLLLAVHAGDGINLESNPAFKSVDGSKTRVAATISSGTRAITTRDAS